MHKVLRAWNPKENLKSLVDRHGSLPPLDGLRAWAVLYVMLYHYALFWPLTNRNQSLAAM